MICKENYTVEHIRSIEANTGANPQIIERTLFAFGLLEAITRAGLNFVFKGGTSLMLLLEEPQRFSTDIDIVVAPGTDIHAYIEKAGRIFPFFHVEEHIRRSKSGIEKRHFKFLYLSPIEDREVTILLDVLFEENHYPLLVKKKLGSSLLITDSAETEIMVPSINCILGDKLTAFAPHTTGVGINEKKELEIVKQLFDCATLLRSMSDFSEVKCSYHAIVSAELSYRNLPIPGSEVLKDTILSALCIAGRGSLYKSPDFAVYARGIRALKTHLLRKDYDMSAAGFDAVQVMYLAASILRDAEQFELPSDFEPYRQLKIERPEFAKLNSMKKISMEHFAYIYESLKIL